MHTSEALGDKHHRRSGLNHLSVIEMKKHPATFAKYVFAHVFQELKDRLPICPER